jgi:hypothetical protein
MFSLRLCLREVNKQGTKDKAVKKKGRNQT